MNDPKPSRLSPAALAKLLLMSVGQLQRLADDGIIPQAVWGRYELEPTVRTYVAHLTDRVARAEVDGSAVLAARQSL